MRTLNQFIIERLKINKDTKIKENNDVLNSILAHFEFDELLNASSSYLEKEPFLTKEEGEEIKSKLLEFIIDNNIVDVKKLKYCTNRGRNFKDKKINKDYKKDNAYWMALNYKLDYKAKDVIEIFKKKGLSFKVSLEVRLIAMYGPYGGVKICEF